LIEYLYNIGKLLVVYTITQILIWLFIQIITVLLFFGCIYKNIVL
jgi:hypothetical protein